ITLDDGTKVVVGSQVGLSERQLLEQDLGRAVLRIESDVNKVALTAEQAITLLGTGGSSVNSKVSALGTYLQGLVGTTGSATGQLATMISELNTAKAALEAASKDVSSITSLLSNLSSAGVALNADRSALSSNATAIATEQTQIGNLRSAMDYMRT